LQDRYSRFSHWREARGLYLAEGHVLAVVGTDGGGDVIIRSSGGGGAASSKGTATGAGGLQRDVGVNGQGGEAGQGNGHESGLSEKHLC